MSSPDRLDRPRTAGDVVRPVLLLLALMWAIEIVDALLPVALDQFGIQGRTASGLVGVALAPLLHGGFGHLMANTVPFLVLGLLVAWRSRDFFWAVLTVVVVLSGLGVWLLTSPATVTIGASSVVFGMPRAALQAGGVDYVLSLDAISTKIAELANRPPWSRRRPVGGSTTKASGIVPADGQGW